MFCNNIEMSVQRNFAQRNNNVTKIIPEFAGTIDLSGGESITEAHVYNLYAPDVQNVGGIYYVDMSGKDLSGNSLNYDGRIYSIGGSNNDLSGIPIILFTLKTQGDDYDEDNIKPLKASNYPGLEFTIFFKNLPNLNIVNGPPPLPLLTIGMIDNDALQGIPLPYILSPPIPSLLGAHIYPNITFKSDGKHFNVTSSGPAGWLGLVAFLELLTISLNNTILL